MNFIPYNVNTSRTNFKSPAYKIKSLPIFPCGLFDEFTDVEYVDTGKQVVKRLYENRKNT